MRNSSFYLQFFFSFNIGEFSLVYNNSYCANSLCFGMILMMEKCLSVASCDLITFFPQEIHEEYS